MVLVHPLGVRGLALSLSVAYTVGALLGLALLRRWFGPLGTAGTWTPLRRVGVATLAMGVVVLVVSNLSGSTHGLLLFARVVGAVVAGLAVYVGVIVVLGRRAAARERQRRRETRASRRLVARHRVLERASPRRRRGRLHPCPVCGS